MFDTPCPECKNNLSLKMRKKLLIHHFIYCYFCNKPIKIRETPQLLNSLALGVLIGVVLAILTKFSLTTNIVIASSVAVLFQRFLDVFFSLVPAEEKDLF